MSRGLVLFAHGARDPQWSHALRELARRVADRAPALPVMTAFLEFQPPDLAEAVAALAPNCADVGILPVFWAPAGHVANELPRLVEACQAAHPRLVLRVLPTLSELPGLLDFIATQAVALATADSAPVKASRTTRSP
jgi:sirohydrochlorin cobaltochelatase